MLNFYIIIDAPLLEGSLFSTTKFRVKILTGTKTRDQFILFYQFEAKTIGSERFSSVEPEKSTGKLVTGECCCCCP